MNNETLIPYIGVFIGIFVGVPFILLFVYRAIGLLYADAWMVKKIKYQVAYDSSIAKSKCLSVYNTYFF